LDSLGGAAEAGLVLPGGVVLLGGVMIASGTTAVVAVASALADGALWFYFGFKNQFDGQCCLIILSGTFSGLNLYHEKELRLEI